MVRLYAKRLPHALLLAPSPGTTLPLLSPWSELEGGESTTRMGGRLYGDGRVRVLRARRRRAGIPLAIGVLVSSCILLLVPSDSEVIGGGLGREWIAWLLESVVYLLQFNTVVQ